MHELVQRISEPKLCYVFARNATARGRPELAIELQPVLSQLGMEDYSFEAVRRQHPEKFALSVA